FCRKTTLTKHFKRYHPTKIEDSGMPDVDEDEEDGGAESDEDDSCSESEANRPETQMKRQSSYYGDHWPLPCETAQLPNPAVAVQGQLALRPKSTMDRVKYERPRSVSPQLIRSIPPADGPTSAFQFSRGRTMSIQTHMDRDFNQIPLPHSYIPEPNIHETSSPCSFPMDTSVGSLTSPTTMSPTSYSDISPIPDSAHSTLFFAGPTSQPFVPHEEPASIYPSGVAMEEVPQHDEQQNQYTLDSKGMIQMQVVYDDNSIPAHQQQPIQEMAYYDGVAYQVPAEQYYGPPPTWYTNIKPEESWPGLLPGDRLNTFASWNQ
ncbi:MAG: hypothetical protein Q9222_007841, partial [Ikaeria aurantiellina]